jgi:hypothetical protein
MPWRPVVGRWSIPFGLACMVVTFAAGSSAVGWAHSAGGVAKWFVLAGVAALAGAVALRQMWLDRRLPSRGLMIVGACAAAFLALALLSSAWSVAPRLSVERGLSLAILFGLAAALAFSTADDVAARLRVLQGLAAGAIAVGILGLVTLVVDRDAALQRATSISPWRYKGFTENPNTISLLAAASVPIMIGLALRAEGRERGIWAGGALLLVGSTVAAESRGPLLAVFLGVCVVFLFSFAEWRPRLVGVTAALVVFAGGMVLREATQPSQPAFTSVVAPAPAPPTVAPAKPRVIHKTSRPRPKKNAPPRGGTGPAGSSSGSGTSGGSAGQNGTSTNPVSTHPRRHNRTRPKPTGNRRHKPHKTVPPQPTTKVPVGPQVVHLPRPEDEIGNPLLTRKNVSAAGSGRVAAWRGTLQLIRERPLLGYGFGTEGRVFVDRWYYFQGRTPENSYLGLLLQLGVLGLGLIVLLGLALLVRGPRTIPALDDEARPVVAALYGVLVAAAGIMLVQSFLYSVGNVATATVWISLFLLGAVVLGPKTRREVVVVPAREERGVLVA